MANGEALPDFRQMALSMARSGRFCSWRLIEIEMRFIQGLREAQALFQDLHLRDDIDDICRAARRHRHPRLPLGALPPVPQYRFRGGALPHPPVIRFLDLTPNDMAAGPDTPPPGADETGAPSPWIVE